jgi:hypothetical protein
VLNELLPTLHKRVAHWAKQLNEEQWISGDDYTTLTEVDTRSASALFDNEERPLVVGFFGGTGVGKSSLLNRLAGENVARTGVERPTSREVTLYLHQTLSINNLPSHFPTDKVKIALHKNQSHRDILWVDMPDFDSVEQENQQLVLEWLPYIDVLIYIVSPERYKDDKGWRMLLEHGLNHAWLFAMNHWDRGSQLQLEDFKSLLSHAGLNNPLIFCTDCNPEKDSGVVDDFDLLESNIQELANKNIIKHLEKRGIKRRVDKLQASVEQVKNKIASADQLDEIADKWLHIWDGTSADIYKLQQLSIDQLATHYASRETSWISTALKTVKGNKNSTPTNTSLNSINPDKLWNEQVQELVNNSIEKLVQHAANHHIAALPLSNAISTIQVEQNTLYRVNFANQLQAALKEPGSRWHRVLHRIIGLATTALPFMAMFWVAYTLITGFYIGNARGNDYLGFNFAIHSLLLIGLAWLIPYVLFQKTKPSLQSAAATGMRLASENTFTQINQQVLSSIESLKVKRKRIVDESALLFSSDLLPNHYSSDVKQQILSRILMRST